MGIAIKYKGELIVAGEQTWAPWVFWTGVIPAPEFDLVEVGRRLTEIYKEDRVTWDRWGDALLFPPAFEVEKDYALGEVE